MKLFYRKYGEGEPIIILHGLYGSSDNWIPIAKSLSDKFEIYLLDQRNHGRSPHSNNHNYNLLSSDLLKFLKSNNIKKATIIGHSMGGKTAMYFANNYPEMVKSLIIVDISPFSYKHLSSKNNLSHSHINIINTLSELDLKSINSISDARILIKKHITEDRLVNFLLKNLKRNSDKKFFWKFNLNTIHKELENILDGFKKDKKNQITIPCLFIKGENSNYISFDDQKNIINIFPNSKIVTIPQSGHWLHAEQQKRFIEIINSWL